MSSSLKLSLPPNLDQAAILKQLDAVLDPELDESILELGFVSSVAAENGHITVELELPTHWCAANFAYLMAHDLQQNLMLVNGVREVTVRLRDHFASAAIESGVNAGKSFAESFPEEAWENLEELRDLFLRKGYISRQEKLLRHLRDAGLSFEEIAVLHMGDIVADGAHFWLRKSMGSCNAPAPEEPVLLRAGPAKVAQRYLERRSALGLDCSPSSPLILDLRGEPVPPEQFESFFVRSRTIRVAAEATGSLCSALLQARNTAAGDI